MIIANSLYPKGNENLKDRAERAMKIFPGNQEFIALYRDIVVGQIGVNAAAQYSSNGLKYYNERDNMAIYTIGSTIVHESVHISQRYNYEGKSDEHCTS